MPKSRTGDTGDVAGPPPWAPGFPPLPDFSEPAPRTLFVCRSEAEACVGAASPSSPGLAVSVRQSDGLLTARRGCATVFGPVTAVEHDADPAVPREWVIDTLQAGWQDVWLFCSDPALLDEMTEAAESLGHTVRRREGPLPDGVADPFSVLSAARVRPTGGAGAAVMSFCSLDPSRREPMAVGDELRMGIKHTGTGTMVGYFDSMKRMAGLHGIVPRLLSDGEAALVRAVRTRVAYVCWGRDDAGAAVQTLVFEIPAAVDAVLADAKLPGRKGQRP